MDLSKWQNVSFKIAKCICHADVLFMFVESLFHPFRWENIWGETLANWIILQRRIKVKLLIEFSKYKSNCANMSVKHKANGWIQANTTFSRNKCIFQQYLKHFHEIKCIFQDIQCTISNYENICLSFALLPSKCLNVFSPNQLSIQMFAAVSVLGWFSIIL